MSKTLKGFGWFFLILAGMSASCSPLALADNESSVAVTFLVLASFFAIPGAVLMGLGRKRSRAELEQQMMISFVRTRDAFSIDELAAHVGKTPGEAEVLLSQEIARYHLPLVHHRNSGRYMRLDRLKQQAQVAERCQSCGGSIGHQIVFEGETLTCHYCGSTVETHAPQQQAPQAGGAQAHAPSPVAPAPQRAPWGQQHPGHQHPGHPHPGHPPPPHQAPGGWGKPPGA